MSFTKKIKQLLIPKKYQRKSELIFENLTTGFSRKSYSQEGEDLILHRIFERKQHGFFVDIGAHHPKRFSNTYLFYKRGWRGINIDATPGSMLPFKRIRNEDINLEIPISSVSQTLDYYMFEDHAINSFSKEMSEDRIKNSSIKFIGIKKLSTKPLSEVLDNYLPAEKEIDFFSIDVEGLDYDVLISNNWNKYKPKIIAVEIAYQTVDEILKHRVSILLGGYGYSLFAKTYNTCIFKL